MVNLINSDSKHVDLLLNLVNQDFYNRDTRIIAIELLGKYLVHNVGGKTLIGKIVETEAYLGEIDPACHFFKSKSNRSSVYHQAGGYTYIYLSYGKHYCFNIIANPHHSKGAILVRALEPVTEISFMKKARGVLTKNQLTNGPGKLTQALQITMDQNKQALFNGSLTIQSENTTLPLTLIGVSSRIGISKAVNWQLRYFIIGNSFISGKKNIKFSILNDTNNLPDLSYYEEKISTSL